jgi:hypothetical protein
VVQGRALKLRGAAELQSAMQLPRLHARDSSDGSEQAHRSSCPAGAYSAYAACGSPWMPAGRADNGLKYGQVPQKSDQNAFPYSPSYRGPFPSTTLLADGIGLVFFTHESLIGLFVNTIFRRTTGCSRSLFLIHFFVNQDPLDGLLSNYVPLHRSFLFRKTALLQPAFITRSPGLNPAACLEYDTELQLIQIAGRSPLLRPINVWHT